MGAANDLPIWEFLTLLQVYVKRPSQALTWLQIYLRNGSRPSCFLEIRFFDRREPRLR